MLPDVNRVVSSAAKLVGSASRQRTSRAATAAPPDSPFEGFASQFVFAARDFTRAHSLLSRFVGTAREKLRVDDQASISAFLSVSDRIALHADEAVLALEYVLASKGENTGAEARLSFALAEIVRTHREAELPSRFDTWAHLQRWGDAYRARDT
jgi:hypothetical protein